MQPNRRWQIPLAEDNVVNRKVAKHLLKKLGCQVDVAGDGMQGVARYAEEEYDAIFMDCQMPFMDGYQAAELIRKQQRGETKIPIVALTAHALLGDREKCLAAGMDDYLTKPLQAAKLAETLMRWLPGERGPNRLIRPHSELDDGTCVV